MRTTTTSLLLSLFAIHHASASGLTDHPGFVLGPEPGSFFEEGGVGSASQAYDPVSDQFVMVFDAQSSDADDLCPVTRWAVGFATSPDGLNWTPDLHPIIEPKAGSFYACIAAHPTLLIDSDTGLWHLWFKAYQEANACEDPTLAPPWGCGAPGTFRVGIGHAVSEDGGQTWNIGEEPVIEQELFGYPSASKIDGQFRMFFSAANPPLADFRMYGSTSSEGITWTTPKPVASPGFADFARDQLMDISAQCRNDETPFVNWVLGRNRSTSGPPIFRDAGLVLGTSSDGFDWDFDTDPYIQIDPIADPSSQFFHHDAIRFVDDLGEEHWAVYRSLTVGGQGFLKLAYTWPTEQTSLPKSQVEDRVCLSPASGGPVTPGPSGCPTDGLEQPDGGAIPVTLDEDGSFTASGITDGAGYVGETDVFAVEVPAGCSLEASLVFDHADPPVAGTSGDLDLVITDGEDTLASSDSTTDDEFAEATNHGTTITWFVEVQPFAAECTPYDLTLTVDCPEGSGDSGDSGEDSGTPDDTGTEPDDSGDTAPPADTGTGGSGGGSSSGCSCDTGGAPLSLLGLGLGLPLILARRRRQA